MSIILTGVLGLTACSAQTDSNAATASSDNGKVLVAYFSATGTTKARAEAIAQATGANLFEITPASPYTNADLNWHNSQSRSSVEMNDDNCRPPLGSAQIDASDYDIVFIGFPIWWDLPPRVVNTWIESQNLEGKMVVPFATSGGSSINFSVKSLRKLYPDVDWQNAKLLNCSTSETAKWAKSVVNQ